MNACRCWIIQTGCGPARIISNAPGPVRGAILITKRINQTKRMIEKSKTEDAGK
jgi:hypothetical protein